MTLTDAQEKEMIELVDKQEQTNDKEQPNDKEQAMTKKQDEKNDKEEPAEQVKSEETRERRISVSTEIQDAVIDDRVWRTFSAFLATAKDVDKEEYELLVDEFASLLKEAQGSTETKSVEIKAGNRHSKADAQLIQNIHDNASQLGANHGVPMESPEKSQEPQKEDPTEQFKKAVEELTLILTKNATAVAEIDAKQQSLQEALEKEKSISRTPLDDRKTTDISKRFNRPTTLTERFG